MKKIENTFAVTGFVGKDAEIRKFCHRKRSTFLSGRKPSGEVGRPDQQGIFLYEF